MNNNYKPIYLTPEEAALRFDEIVASVRGDLTIARGKLRDLEKMYLGWKERVDFAAGGLTCVIVGLYDGQVEYRAYFEKSSSSLGR